MSQQPLEIILSRQFADSLSIAAFIVDPQGDLLFYNEEAESILGQRFSETGKMEMEEWSTVFKPTDGQGNPLRPDQLPLVESLQKKVPAFGKVHIKSRTGESNEITIISFPISGRTKESLGAMALFVRT